MKRFFTFAILFFVLFSNLFSEDIQDNNNIEQKFCISIAPVYTLENGTLFEYVFIQLPETEEISKLSELTWPLKNISYFGGNVDLSYKLFTMQANITHSRNQKSGDMEDYDWLNLSERNLCTNYSISQNTLESAINFNLKVGLNFNPISTFYINPFAGYSYKSYKFYAVNGFYQYSDGTLPYNHPSVETKILSEDSAISYKRIASCMILGTNVNYTLFDSLTLGLQFYTTPIFYTRSIDHHFSGLRYYLDIISDYFKEWDFGFSVKYLVWNQLSVISNFSYSFIIPTYGINYQHDGEEEIFYDTELTNVISACGGNWWNFSVGVSWTF